MLKRAVSILLCLMMIVVSVSLAACGGDKKDDTVTTKPNGNGNATDAPDVTTDAPETEAQCPVEEQSLGGYEFLVFEGSFGGKRTDFLPSEEEATPLSEAIFRRNTLVEDRLDVVITSKQQKCGSTSGSTEGYGEMMKQKTAGVADYDLVSLPAYDETLMAYNGCNYDLFHIDTINLDGDYWEQQVVKELPIKGLLFFVSGDASIDCLDSVITFCFNKKLAKEYNLPDLYDLVTEGKWTMDKWIEISSLISKDLDGDGYYTDQDLYGSLLWDDTIYAVVHGVGGRCCEIDSNGDLVLTLGTERIVTAFQRFVEYGATQHCLRYQQKWNYTTGKGTNNSGVLGTPLFANDQGLFYSGTISEISRLRDMETDYGILPVFKYDETQETYQCTVAPYNARFMSVLVNHPDIELVGNILETIMWYSKQTIVPAFYDQTLNGQRVRDEESLPMLELIRNNRVYDLGYYYQPANINKQLIALFKLFDSNWSSKYASLEKAATRAVGKINTSYDKLVESWSK